jgi:hypothetical protein
MKADKLIFLAFVLTGALFGCHSRKPPVAPGADQVRAWAGFPEGFQLKAEKGDAANDKSFFGKPIWEASYGNSNRSLVTTGIIICEPGTLWGAKRAQVTKGIEDTMAKMAAIKNPEDSKAIAAMKKSFSIVALPNGHKAYFTVVGFGPGGTGYGAFSYERDYDLFVIEDFGSDDVTPDKKMKNPVTPTNDLPTLFGKIEAFLEAQQK